MFESLSPLLRSIVNAILIGLGGFLAAFLISWMFSRVTKKTWGRIIGSLLAVGIAIWTIKLLLDTTGAVGAFVILGTAFTGALSLGSDRIFGDLVSGVILFATRPFKLGDVVEIAGHTGEVAEVALTYTALLGDAGDRVIVRNSEVGAGTIVNYSTHAKYMIDVRIDIPANQDLEKAVTAIINGAKEFASDDASVGVICESVSGGQMNLVVHAFASGRVDRESEKTKLMIAALRALKQGDIRLKD